MPLDLASVLFLPSNRRQLCFLSIALGLMVDLDIGTENMRWMGDTRFVVGFIKGIINSKNFKCRLRLKVVESDKVEMARLAREAAKVDLRLGQNRKGKEVPLRQAPGGRPAKETNGDSSTTAKEQEQAEEVAPKFEEGEKDEGPLDIAEPLQHDDSWLCIDSTTSRVARRPHVTPDANTDGAWRDGDGMLYM